MNDLTDLKNVKLISHPVILHKLSVIRDKSTSAMSFRQIMEEMSEFLAYEATRDLKLTTKWIETPLEKMEGHQVSENWTIVAILRAGMGMLSGMLQILPFATVGHIGIYRDKFIHGTVEYYLRLPKSVKGSNVLLLDPMLASGETACAAIDRLKEHEVGKIRLISLLSSREGIQKINSIHPDVEIYTLSVERALNEKGYLLPGIGDAGDRLFDTVQ